MFEQVDIRVAPPRALLALTVAVHIALAAALCALQPLWLAAAAAPLLVFCLLYTPCIAAVASVKRELGGKWAFIMVANQCIVAWLAAFGTRLIMML